MNRVTLFLGVIITLWGCDNSERFLEALNDIPRIAIIDEDNATVDHSFWMDSAKVSSEVGLFPYRFRLSIEDFNQNIEIVNVENEVATENDTLNGFLLFQYDTILIDVEVVNIDHQNQLIDLEVLAFDESLLTISFIVIDAFMQSDTALLQLEVFDNLKPVVNFEIKADESGDLVRIIDLSNSYDGDAKYGGMISSYHWIIEGTEFSLTRDFIRFAFPDRGTFDVQVYTTDNNGAQSNFETIEVIIQ